MLNCHDAERRLARGLGEAIGDSGMDAELNQHLAECANCRETLAHQRRVADALAQRSDTSLPAGFAGRLSARLDAESDWLGSTNWRTWTVRLAPLAAGLLVAAALTIEPAAADDTIDLYDVTETWTLGTDVDVLPTTALFWQADVSDESLLEVILTTQPDDPLDGADYDQ